MVGKSTFEVHRTLLFVNSESGMTQADLQRNHPCQLVKKAKQRKCVKPKVKLKTEREKDRKVKVQSRRTVSLVLRRLVVQERQDIKCAKTHCKYSSVMVS